MCTNGSELNDCTKTVSLLLLLATRIIQHLSGFACGQVKTDLVMSKPFQGSLACAKDSMFLLTIFSAINSSCLFFCSKVTDSQTHELPAHYYLIP